MGWYFYTAFSLITINKVNILYTLKGPEPYQEPPLKEGSPHEEPRLNSSYGSFYSSEQV
jgi:hypothetical protein